MLVEGSIETRIASKYKLESGSLDTGFALLDHGYIIIMPFTIRKAESKDAPALGHIQVTSWRSAFRNIAPDDYLNHQVSRSNQTNGWKEILADSEQVVYVAEVDDKTIGYAWAHSEDDKSIEWDAELISMHILPEYKRQGVGRKLFAAVAEQLKEEGFRSVYLWVLEDNHPSRKFYEALGGQLTGSHQINLGGKDLTEVAYGWKDINTLFLGEISWHSTTSLSTNRHHFRE